MRANDTAFSEDLCDSAARRATSPVGQGKKNEPGIAPRRVASAPDSFVQASFARGVSVTLALDPALWRWLISWAFPSPPRFGSLRVTR